MTIKLALFTLLVCGLSLCACSDKDEDKDNKEEVPDTIQIYGTWVGITSESWDVDQSGNTVNYIIKPFTEFKSMTLDRDGHGYYIENDGSKFLFTYQYYPDLGTLIITEQDGDTFIQTAQKLTTSSVILSFIENNSHYVDTYKKQ